MWSLMGFNSLCCCSGQALCGFMCGSCLGKLKPAGIQNARLAYVGFYCIVTLLGILTLVFAPVITDKLQILGLAECENGGVDCLGVNLVHHLSFTLGGFHLLMMLSNLIGGKISLMLEEGCWALKLLIVACLLVLSFFIPSSVFVRDI